MALSRDSTEFLEAQLQEQDSLKDLLNSAYARLHMLARRERGKLPAGETMRTTALVNEAYLRLHKFAENHSVDRHRFYGLCATIMRRIIIDAARKQRDFTRHADKHLLNLEDQQPQTMLDLDRALNDLAERNARAAQVVECRFFAGYGNQEIADILGVNEKTVRRDWLLAKAFLLTVMESPDKPNPDTQ